MGQIILLTLPGIGLALVLRYLIFKKRLRYSYSLALSLGNGLVFGLIYQLANVYPTLATISAGMIAAMTFGVFWDYNKKPAAVSKQETTSTKGKGEPIKEVSNEQSEQEKNIVKASPLTRQDLFDKTVLAGNFDKNSENIPIIDKGPVGETAPTTPKVHYLTRVFEREVRIISIVVVCFFLLGFVYYFFNENGGKHLVLRHQWNTHLEQPFSDSSSMEALSQVDNKIQTLTMQSRMLGWEIRPHTRNISATDFHKNEAKEIFIKAIIDALWVAIIAGLAGYVILGLRWVVPTLRQ